MPLSGSPVPPPSPRPARASVSPGSSGLPGYSLLAHAELDEWEPTGGRSGVQVSQVVGVPAKVRTRGAKKVSGAASWPPVPVPVPPTVFVTTPSLMAAVVASGSSTAGVPKAFSVAEAERLGRDPMHWVRQEASVVVCALAKVEPAGVVMSSLLPLVESLLHDPSGRVRHSAVLALPSILSKLTPEHRQKLALDTILPLAQDEEFKVRSAVMEALGEIMYTFAKDEGGPPESLLKLFLGIREKHDPGGHQAIPPTANTPVHVQPCSITATTSTSLTWAWNELNLGDGPDIYDDPKRPLICAFNLPAAALTLGKDRWHQLRPLYTSLAQNHTLEIRRSLAASLGEIAKIIGEEWTRADLLQVFLSNLRAEESEVRMIVIETLQTFVRALGKRERAQVAKALENVFSSGKLGSWREREKVVQALDWLVEMDGIDGEFLRKMLVNAFNDRVAAVREAAVGTVPACMKAWKGSPALLEVLRADIAAFASAESFRGRAIFVACIQEMLISDEGDVAVGNATFWQILAGLVKDPVVDVRIRVARLIALIFDKFGSDNDLAATAVAYARELMGDSSYEVVKLATAVLQVPLRRPAPRT